MYEAKILPKIKEGMCHALSDAQCFSEDFAAIANAEYLITTNIAQAISELGPLRGGEPIIIRLELSTKKFATSCVPLTSHLKLNNGQRPKSIFRKSKNSKRNGRIDIAVEEQLDALANRPICAIEVKGFNQAKNLIISDLRRNAEFFDLQCRTGSSLIEFAAFCSFHTFDGGILAARKPSDFLKINELYNEYMKSVNLNASAECELHPFTASESLLSGEESEEEYETIAHEIHHHVGMVVIFRWKGKLN